MERLLVERTEEEKLEEKEKNKMRKRRARAAKIVMETKVRMEMERRAKWREEYIQRQKQEFDTWRPVVYTCPSGLKGPQLAIVSKKEWSDSDLSRLLIKVWSILRMRVAL